MSLGTKWPEEERGEKNQVGDIFSASAFLPARVTALADSVPS